MKKISALWMFCADNYLAPVYSDCFQNIDEFFQYLNDMINEKPLNLQIIVQKRLEMQGCQMLKQSEHFFKVECIYMIDLQTLSFSVAIATLGTSNVRPSVCLSVCLFVYKLSE